MDREQALDVALGQIERNFGKGAVMRMSDQAQVSVGAISTGSLSLDLALGIGGLPRGRMVVLRSNSSIARSHQDSLPKGRPLSTLRSTAVSSASVSLLATARQRPLPGRNQSAKRTAEGLPG